MLLVKPVQWSQQDSIGSSLLHVACAGGNVNIVKSILQCDGVNINQPDLIGTTPLMASAQQGDPIIVQELISRKADQTLTDNYGRSAVDIAIAAGHSQVVSLLNGKEEFREMMVSDDLFAAVSWMKEVQEDCVQPGKVHDYEEKVVTEYCKQDTKDLIGVLGKIKAKSVDKRKKLVRQAVEILSNRNPDPNAIDSRGTPILYTAVRLELSEVVGLLVQMGADRTIQAEDGSTPLITATILGSVDVVKAMVNDVSDLWFVSGI